MLGMASSAFSSSRYRSRLTLMKSMTLSMRIALLRARPSPVVVGRPALGLEFFEMRLDVLACGRQQRRIETMIDGFGDRLHAVVSARKRVDHLALAPQPVLDVAANHVGYAGRIRNRRPVRWKQRAGVERENAI